MSLQIEQAPAFILSVERSRPGFVKVRAAHSASIQAIEVEVREEDQPRIGERLWVSVAAGEKQ